VENGEFDRDAVGVVGGFKNSRYHVLDGGPDPPPTKWIIWGMGHRSIMYRENVRSDACKNS